MPVTFSNVVNFYKQNGRKGGLHVPKRTTKRREGGKEAHARVSRRGST